jgi:hypothetical protein
MITQRDSKVAKLWWLLDSQCGVNPMRAIQSLRGLPRFLRDYRKFRSGFEGKLNILPCLGDWDAEGGRLRNEYFWQDLHVARKIFLARPEKHVDVGSRIDGFVAHVASFMELEMFDIRPISVSIPGVRFVRVDLTRSADITESYCDSISCLHALEHFGMGRYGDPVNPLGHVEGISNMARMLRSGGTLYLSVPIGLERVEFNAHRVFSPGTILDLARRGQLTASEVALVGPNGDGVQGGVSAAELDRAGREAYRLAMFTFVKR